MSIFEAPSGRFARSAHEPRSGIRSKIVNGLWVPLSICQHLVSHAVTFVAELLLHQILARGIVMPWNFFGRGCSELDWHNRAVGEVQGCRANNSQPNMEMFGFVFVAQEMKNKLVHRTNLSAPAFALQWCRSRCVRVTAHDGPGSCRGRHNTR